MRDQNTNKIRAIIWKGWTTPDTRNTPSTTNLEEEEIVDALGNDSNASMPEQVKRPNPRRKVMMMMMMIYLLFDKGVSYTVAPTIQRQTKDDLYFIRKAVFVSRNDDLIE